MPTSSRAPSRRRFKRVLTVRMLAAQTAWLDSSLRWHDGRVVWTNSPGAPGQSFTPSISDLAQAQRNLNKVEHYPIAAQRALGNHQTWLTERRTRLEVAKRLLNINAPDLALLTRPSYLRNPANAIRLSHLLLAEALCLNSLPISPSHTLLHYKGLARQPLHDLMHDDTAPLAGRALAAMTLGALIRKWEHDTGTLAVAHHGVPNFAWLQRAYQWGLCSGLPQEPGLIITLLAADEGQLLARRCDHAMRATRHFDLPAELLREQLHNGIAPERVVALVEAALHMEPLAQQLLQAPRDYRPLPTHKLNDHLEQLLQRRRTIVSTLAENVREYARLTADPEVLHLTAVFMHSMMDLANTLNHDDYRERLSDLVSVLAKAAVEVLATAKSVSPPLIKSYLSILTKHHAVLWVLPQLPKGKHTYQAADKLRASLEETHRISVKQVRKLLVACGDEEIVWRALELNVLRMLSHFRWSDRERYRLALSLARSFSTTDTKRPDWKFHNLFTIVGSFSSTGEARAALKPLVETLRSAKPELQEFIFFEVLDEVSETQHHLRVTLPRLIRYVPHLMRYLEATKDVDHCWRCIEAMIVLDNSLRLQAAPATHHGKHEKPAKQHDELQPNDKTTIDTSLDELTEDDEGKPDIADKIDLWIGWLLSEILRGETEKRKPVQYWSLKIVAKLAAVLAEGDLERFQIIFRVAVHYDFSQNTQHIEAGLATLARYPALAIPLSQLFPQQIERCATLLERLGLVTRLGADALAPLQELESYDFRGTEHSESERLVAAYDKLNQSLTPAWQQVHGLVPDLAPLITSYHYAKRLLKQDSELPPGLQGALNLPQKLANELRYLEQLEKENPDKPHIAARIRSLHARLQDTAGLQKTLCEEIQERLPQLTGEAQLAAAEAQVLACYRGRLAVAAGPVPDDLIMTPDLLNATLLTVDIEDNRRLLRQLLRAHLNGEHVWREQHPANQLLLRTLEFRGINTRVWLSAHPKTYQYVVPGKDSDEKTDASANDNPAHDNSITGRVRLHLEQDPLHILQMGNYFDTCLSFGGCNAFSTVANACELNKRVIYAKDNAGRIVGRKLIGINSEGNLVGFRTYTSMADALNNEALQAIFRQYVIEFAVCCGLQLDDEGNVPTLFAQGWYDDGVVSWDAEVTKPPRFDIRVATKRPSLESKSTSG